jgi:hypothetical protein
MVIIPVSCGTQARPFGYKVLSVVKSGFQNRERGRYGENTSSGR